MTAASTDSALSRRAFVLIALCISILFFALRLPLVAGRDAFFDELFTLWISTKSPAGIWNALQLDSGPPLYYFVTHALFALTKPALTIARSISLAVSAIALVVLFVNPLPRRTRLAAAFFFVIFPAAVYFASEARAYALAGALGGVGVILLDRWSEAGRTRDLAFATALMVAAAWAHDYGVLLFPLPVLFALLSQGDRMLRIRAAIVATVAEAILFAPGFMLAMRQPVEATVWMGSGWGGRNIEQTLIGLTRLSFASRYPDVFSPSPTAALRIVSIATVVFILAFGTRTRCALRWAIATIVPFTIALAFAFAGRTIYFPFRFEAFLAIPFVVWLAAAWNGLPRLARLASAVIIAGTAAIALTLLMTYQLRKSGDPYRAAAKAAVAVAGTREHVVASGLVYLEVVSRGVDAEAFPAEQARHPGWRALSPVGELEREADTLRRAGESIIWVGEPVAPEYGVLAKRFAFAPIARYGPVVVARATPRE